jgi:N-methylhydantoinase B
MNVKTTTRTGRAVMASIGPVGGGAGGGPMADGAEGCGANMSYLKNTPVEMNEAEVPILVRRYGLVTDSGGPGLYRGGSALEMEFQVFSPQTMVTARNRDRSIFSAWGLRGGGPGRVSRFARNPGTAECVELGSADVVLCEPSDIILIQGPGAGGYGDPTKRAAEAVIDDVRRGFISIEAARTDYGVVLNERLIVDAPATSRLRESMAMAPTGFGHGEFRHGAGRIAFESVWSLDRYDALHRILVEVPVTWRFFVKHRIFGAIKFPGGVAEVIDAYEKLRRQFADLPPVPEPVIRAQAAE